LWADKLAALRGKGAATCSDVGSECALCDRDHSDRRCAGSEENDAMTNSRTYEGWWHVSLIDERNERPLHVALVHVALVAVIAIWATALLFALV
jgi:hypothetical protein